MTIKISGLWAMWLGAVIFDVICIKWPFFAGAATPAERALSDLYLAWFISFAWVWARWIEPLISSPSTEGGNGI